MQGFFYRMSSNSGILIIKEQQQLVLCLLLTVKFEAKSSSDLELVTKIYINLQIICSLSSSRSVLATGYLRWLKMLLPCQEI